VSTTQSETGRATSWKPGQPSGGQRMSSRPDLPQRGRPSKGLIIAALLAVIGSALLVATVVVRAGDKTEVLVIGEKSVPEGQVIERADLVSRPVAGLSDAIPVTSADEVVGKTAAVDLLPGQVLMPEMVTSDPVPGKSQSLVGLALDPTRIPAAGLQPGDVVDVIAVPPASATGGGAASAEAKAELESPPMLSEDAVVYSVDGGGTAGGQQLLTLVVDAKDAARLAAYSTSNRVAVIEVSGQEP